MTFEAGMRMSLDRRARAEEMDLRRQQEARAQQLHGLQVAQLERAAQRDKDQDIAFKGYEDVSARGGMTAGLEGMVESQYGMTPDQQRGLGAGLQDKLREYDKPDNFDLQSTPQGMPSANVAAISRGLDIESAKQRELLKARQKIAVARRDVEGLRAGELEGRQIDLNEDLRRTAQLIQDPMFRQNLDRFINEHSPRVNIGRETDAKGNPVGPYIAMPVGKDGQAKPITLSDQQYLQLAHAHVLAARGETQAATALMRQVNGDIADAIAGHNKSELDRGRFNETGRHNAATEENARLQRLQAAASLRYQQDRDRFQLINPQQGFQVGADGRMVPVITGLRMSQKTGDYETVTVPMPQAAGFIPAGALDPTKYARQAESMVGTPMTSPEGTPMIDANGKPRLHTQDTAMQALMQQAIRSYSGPQAQQGLDPKVLKAMEERLAGPQAASRGGAPGGALPTPQKPQGSAPGPSWMDKPGHQVLTDWIRAGRPAPFDEPLLDKLFK